MPNHLQVTTIQSERPLLAAFFLLLTLGLISGCSGSNGESKPISASAPSVPAPAPVFVRTESLAALSDSGALVLDARSPAEYAAGHIPGSINAPWQSFSQGENSGLLLNTNALQDKLRDHGLDEDERVVVYGAWDKSWGEEGRIYWMLEFAGVTQASVLEGGIGAWKARGGKTTTEPSTPERGNYAVRLHENVRATMEVVQAASDNGTLVVLDTRERQEYDGATPYGSARGGHIPGAHHFYWKDVFAPDGQLHGEAILKTRFADMGIQNESVVVSYCTGGIRSGFVYTVMRHLGYTNPQNYDGSWWEWSQANAE